MANRKGYRAIKEESERVGWPTHFRTDLTKHDRNTLSKKDMPREFGWVLREHGTHLLFSPCDGINLDWAKVISHNTEARFYWFDGEDLRPVSPQE